MSHAKRTPCCPTPALPGSLRAMSGHCCSAAGVLPHCTPSHPPLPLSPTLSGTPLPPPPKPPLPGSLRAMSDHLLPSCLCAATSCCSSASVHASLRMSGCRWWFQRCRKQREQCAHSDLNTSTSTGQVDRCCWGAAVQPRAICSACWGTLLVGQQALQEQT
jgi:hypothetical protein